MRCDEIDLVAPCLCGEGQVKVVMFSPNAPFARLSYGPVQVLCENCKDNPLSSSECLYKWEYA